MAIYRIEEKRKVGKLGTKSTDDRDREGETFTVPTLKIV